MKILYTILMTLAITACAGKDQIIKTNYVTVEKPVPTVPRPPEVKKPVLATEELTPEDRKDLGKVAKALVIENKQLRGYVTILESIVDKYRELAEQSEFKSELKIEDKN